MHILQREADIFCKAFSALKESRDSEKSVKVYILFVVLTIPFQCQNKRFHSILDENYMN